MRSRVDIGKVTSITVVGGNTFGLSTPIITGYIVSLSGSFRRAFIVANLLPLLVGAIFFPTRWPIRPHAEPVPRFVCSVPRY